MDASKHPKNDPSVLLLNEIDILLAQTRLMELYLKQAQATAANETSLLQEQHEGELAALRSSLDEKERQLAIEQSRIVQADRNLSAQIHSLERQLDANQSLLSGQEASRRQASDEIAALHSRIAQLEAANETATVTARDSAAGRESLQSELVTLRRELEEDRRNFQQQQQASRELEQSLQAQLQLLRNQLAEKQAWSLAAGNELQQAKSEIIALHQRIAALHASQKETETSAARELEQARARFENELAGLRDALADRDHSLQHHQASLAGIERGLRAEIVALRGQLEQRQLLLESREGELRDAQTQTTALQQRIADLEAEYQHSAASQLELENVRRSFANELAVLQHEVTVKERELTQHQEAVGAVELALHGKIQALQQELARAHNELEERNNGLQITRAQEAALRDQIAELQAARTEIQTTATRQLEETRQRFENDLNRLHAALAQKEYALSEQEKAFKSLEERLGAEIGQLRRQMEQEQSLSSQASTDLHQARSELARLREQNDQFEQARQQWADSSQQAAAIRANLEVRLKEKEDELSIIHGSASEREQQLNRRVNDLQLELAEKRLLVESKSAELDHLRASVNQLTERITEEQTARNRGVGLLKDTEERNAAELAQLSAARDQHLFARQEIETQLAQARGSEVGLRTEIQDISNRAAAVQALLNERDRSFEATQAENAQLRSRVLELESEGAAQKAHASQELNKVRDDLQSELAALRRELQQKAWTLAQHQATVENLAQTHRNQVEKLEERLSEQQQTSEGNLGELQKAQAESAALQSRIEELDKAVEQTQLSRAREVEQTKQEFTARIDALTAELAAKAAELFDRDAAETDLEQSVRNEIARLSAEAQVKSAAIVERDDQMRRLNADLSALREGFAQAESAAAGNLEQIREEYAARIDVLNTQLSEQSKQLMVRDAAQSDLEQTLRSEIARYRAEAQAKSAALEGRDAELQSLSSEIAPVKERFAQLELAATRAEADARESSQAKKVLELELSTLRQELQQKAWALAQQQAAVENLAQTHRSQIQKLEAQIGETQRSTGQHHAELEKANAQSAALHRRIEELQGALQHAELTGVGRAEQIRREYSARLDSLSAELAEKNLELRQHASSQPNLDQTSRDEIDRLISEAQERNQILQNRNDELVRVKAQMDELLERHAQLEAAAAQTESAAMAESERVRTEFHAQLALLQAELSQKEWALEERQAVATGREMDYREQLETLRHQLAEKEIETATPPEENDQESAAPPDVFVMGDPQLTEAQRARLKKLEEMLETIKAGNDSYPAAPGRRWRTGFAWKRRWKS